jgi:hypothetical protein
MFCLHADNPARPTQSNFPTTRDLIDRLQSDALLRSICGWPKVMAHLMFGILALTVDQLLRLSGQRLNSLT